METEKESEWYRCRDIITWRNSKRKASPYKDCISDYTLSIAILHHEPNDVLKTFSAAEITDSIISLASVVSAPCEHQ